MNRSKARDFYSEYYENTLSAGLRQTMENAFASDPGLRRDYDEFVSLMAGLDGMQSEEIPPVGFLSERIDARLNQIDLERRTTQRPFLLRFWMPVTATAVAGAALVGFLLALQPQAGGDPSISNLGPSQGTSAMTPKLSMQEGEALLTYKASGKVDVTIRLDLNGEVVDQFALDNNMLRSPLRNMSDKAVLLHVDFSNSANKLLVALPGRRQTEAGSGSGTVLDFAKALAGTYQIPVEVSTKHLEAPVEWNLTGKDPVNEIDDSMKSLGITIDVRESKILLLAD